MIEEIFPSLFVVQPGAKAKHTPVAYLLRRPEGNSR